MHGLGTIINVNRVETPARRPGERDFLLELGTTLGQLAPLHASALRWAANIIGTNHAGRNGIAYMLPVDEAVRIAGVLRQSGFTINA